jgi:hypothetical protein
MGERGLTVGDSTEKVSRLQSDLGTTNGALESLNEGEKNNSKEIGELNAVLKSKKDAIKKLQSELNTAKANTQTSEEKIAELETLLENAKSELVESTSKLESLEKINKEYAESIHKLKSEKENLETQIAELVASGKKEKESAQEKLDNTAQANFVLSEIVKESQRKVDRAELSVDKWVKRVEDKNSEIATLKQEIARIKKEGEEEKARLVEINNKIIANKSSLKNLLNGDLIDQDYLIDSLEDELKTLEEEKNAIEILVTHSQNDFNLQSEELQKKLVELEEAKQTTTKLANELGEMIIEKERLENLNQAQREKEKSQKDAIASLSHQLVGYKKAEVQRKKKERQEVLAKQYEEENSAIEELLKKQEQSKFDGAQYLDDLEEFEVDTKQALSLKEEGDRKRKFEEDMKSSRESAKLRMNAQEKYVREQEKLEEEGRQKKKEYTEKIAKAGSTVELFDLAKEYLNLTETENEVLEKEICDYLYKNKDFNNKKLEEVGFIRELFLARGKYVKSLESAAKVNSWLEMHKHFVENIAGNMLKYTEDNETNLGNVLNDQILSMAKYIPKHLLSKFVNKKREDIEVNRTKISSVEFAEYLRGSENLKLLKSAKFRGRQEDFVNIITGTIRKDLLKQGKKTLLAFQRKFRVDDLEEMEILATTLFNTK